MYRLFCSLVGLDYEWTKARLHTGYWSNFIDFVMWFVTTNKALS